MDDGSIVAVFGDMDTQNDRNVMAQTIAHLVDRIDSVEQQTDDNARTTKKILVVFGATACLCPILFVAMALVLIFLARMVLSF